MRGLIFKLILLGVIGFAAYVAYFYYQTGLVTRPEMPEGAFSLSYKSGLRAIMIDIPNEKKTRRYLGHPSDVPFYIKYAWAHCYPPSEEERIDYRKHKPESLERLDALCRLQVDGKTVIRGYITTVPRL